MSGQRKALIIANDEYEQDALSNLLAPGADAEALGRVLGDEQIGDFSVRVIRNKPSHVIEAEIEDLFAESRPDDVLLLHFSGHGLKSESGALFFAASNTRPKRLRATAISADFVQECMQESRSRSIVLLLDCCYGGAFAQGVKVRAAGDINVLDSFSEAKSGGRGRAVITASNAMEYAFEGDQLADDQHQRPSVFTGALVKGLMTGDADRDEDGWISLSELYDYVFDEVREQNPHQTPSRQVELEGELYLARSRRRRIRAIPIPPDLQAAVTDANIYTRRGAVHELQSRLASEDLPVAVGAYEVLADLARTDVRYVADLAAAAVSQAAIHPETVELHFGEVRQDSEPPHQRVRLLGPPIAQVCAPRVSHDWISVNDTPTGLDISVSTSGTGPRSGTIDLKGPTGTAVISVDAVLIAQSSRTSAPHRPVEQIDEMAGSGASPTGQPSVQFSAKGESAAKPLDLRKPLEKTRERVARSSDVLSSRPTVVRRPAERLVPGKQDSGSQADTATPAMPVVEPGQDAGSDPRPLVDGFSPTIGWQIRPVDEGGPAFVILRRNVFGTFKAAKTYPMNEHGWINAWRYLVVENPDAAAHIAASLRPRSSAPATSPQSPEESESGGDSAQVRVPPPEMDQVLSDPPIEGLGKLADMLDRGLLTREEFEAVKARIIGSQA
jgi:hypothetical protein